MDDFNGFHKYLHVHLINKYLHVHLECTHVYMSMCTQFFNN